MLAIIVSALGCGQAPPAGQELVLRGPALARSLSEALQGTTARFDSTGCWVHLRGAFGEQNFSFALPDRVRDLGYAGEIRYRIRDINLKDLRVTASDRDFIITAAFESNGVELKGVHSLLGDAAVPDVELDNMVLSVMLRPVITGSGSISYEQPRVDFKADVDNTFVPRFAISGRTIDVMDTLTNYRRDLCRSIEVQIQKALDSPERKAALARKIGEVVASSTKASPVAGLQFRGSDLIVRLKR